MNIKKILLAPVKGAVAVAKLPGKGVDAATNAAIDSVLKKVFQSVVRHALTSLGAVLLTHGLGASETEAVSGALMTIAGIVWSVLEKKYLVDNGGKGGDNS